MSRVQRVGDGNQGALVWSRALTAEQVRRVEAYLMRRLDWVRRAPAKRVLP